MSRTQIQKTWVIKCRIPLEWKDLVDKKMLELGCVTYAEFVRELIRRTIHKGDT